jgi:Flp pilus assembly protein TadD
VLAAATAAEWRNRGLMQLGGEAPQLAYDDFRKAVAKAPRDVEALDGLARAAARVGRLGDADAFLREVAAKAGSVPALIELSTVLAARGRIEEAAQAAQQAVSLEPANAAALEQLASVYADQGDEEALERLVRSLDRADPDQALALYCETRLSYLRGDFERAAQFGEKLVALQRADATAFNLLGSVYAALGQNDRARRAFEHSLKVNPRDPAVLVNLGLAELRAADPAAAAKRFAEALVLYPTLAPALTGLADALEQQGYVARAAKIRSFRPGR